MAVLTFPIDNNISELQYQQALMIAKQYRAEQRKQARKQKRIEDKAQELKEYQLKNFKPHKPIEPKEVRVVKLLSIRTPEQKAEIRAEAKAKQLKRLKPELGANGEVTHFNLNLDFTPQFVKYLQDYFSEFKKRKKFNANRMPKADLKDINIFKFNRITDFKTHHVITLVKFLNENELPCTHRVEGNKLISKIN